MTTNEIKTYRNLETGEIAPAHRIGTDELGCPVYLVPPGWEPEQPYWLDTEGNAHADS